MRIEIFGTGCPKCQLMTARLEAVAKKLGVEYELQHVTSLGEMRKRGVTFTPALAIDGQLKVSGKVPSEADLNKMLTKARTQ